MPKLAKLYRSAVGHAWVGECQQDATHTADIPNSDDSRWVIGIPETLDVEVLTLSPFYPSGRPGVCVELKKSKPLTQYQNHPPFEGCKAWMSVDAIDWQPIALTNIETETDGHATSEPTHKPSGMSCG